MFKQILTMLKETNRLEQAAKCLMKNRRYSVIYQGRVYDIVKQGKKHFLVCNSNLMF